MGAAITKQNQLYANWEYFGQEIWFSTGDYRNIEDRADFVNLKRETIEVPPHNLPRRNPSHGFW